MHEEESLTSRVRVTGMCWCVVFSLNKRSSCLMNSCIWNAKDETSDDDLLHLSVSFVLQKWNLSRKPFFFFQAAQTFFLGLMCITLPPRKQTLTVYTRVKKHILIYFGINIYNGWNNNLQSVTGKCVFCINALVSEEIIEPVWSQRRGWTRIIYDL